MHALGLLDVDDDPVFEAVSSLAARMGRGRCGVWLRGSSRDGDLRPVAGVDGTGREGDPELGWHARDSVLRHPVTVSGIEVGEVRGTDVDEAVVAHAAAAVRDVLEVRWEAMRRDEKGGPVGVVSVNDQLDIVWASAEAVELSVASGLDPLVGKHVLDLVHNDELAGSSDMLAQTLGGRGRTSVVGVNLRLGESAPARFDIWGDNRLSDSAVGALTFVVRKADDRSELTLLADQLWVLNRLSAGEPLGEVLNRVTQMVEHRDPAALVCIMEFDESSEALHPLMAPRLPVPVVGKLIGLKVGAGEAAGGGSIHAGITQYTPNVAVDPAYAELAPVLEQHGLRSCWSIPIRSLADAKVLGSIDVYRTEVGNPSDAESNILVLAARLAAIAMDHDSRERELRHQAMHDPLTDLPNRAMFSERLEAAAEDGNVGVLFVDLDRFKLVNDTLGHEFGDEVLKVIGRRMDEHLEDPILVARFGGDEFTVLVPKVESSADLVSVAEGLLEAIAEPFDIRGHRIVLDASAGAAMATDRPEDPQSLVRDADSALYHAKERGRGRVEVFDDRMRQADAERVRIEGVLREAIAEKRIMAHFQPTIRVSDGQVVGAEALARCDAANGAPLTPDRFIPVAEEVGLLSAVFDAVLTEACEMSVVWNQQRAERFTVWVNLSPVQLGPPAVVDQIARIFRETGVDASTIGFEVTESGIIPDPQEAADFLQRLKALGAHIAIDDFGTGYSSLGYLQALPVDTVKLDRSFVIRAGDDLRSRAIVRSVVDLTRAMRLSCVAEGVETVEQLDVITDLGCELVQGFVYARPTAASAFTDWLSSRP
ncbi:MAG: EAL domain-containing protein [Acidimicrobiales bacterium]|nr:EAL domain-containing protein [Acidimicrobiales bacterium]